MTAAINPEAIAANLASLAGLGAVASLAPLAGGRNNRGFVLSTPDGTRAFLKLYFTHPGDGRDRFGAESAFTRFLAAAGIPGAPRPLAQSREHNAILFTFAAGRHLTPGEPDQNFVAQAAAFFAAINARRDDPAAAALPTASEACLRVADHLELIGKRVDRVMQTAAAAATGATAPELASFAAFARRDLAPAWESVRRAALAQPAKAGDRELAPGERCLSPSDFGFHNALVDAQGGLTFLDFEYAGWDDPAKTICDFFLQPAVPAPPGLAGHFASLALAPLDLPDDAMARARLLFPAYAVKWTCILLNDFCRLGAKRRDFARGESAPPQTMARQLDKAAAMLGRAQTNELHL